jgi:hypothetical protein
MFRWLSWSGSLIGRGRWASGRALSMPLVRAVGVVEDFVLAQCVQQMSLVPDQCPVQQSRRQVRTHRSMKAFMRGTWTPLSTTLMPASARTASNLAG